MLHVHYDVQFKSLKFNSLDLLPQNGICLLWDDKQWAQKNEKEDVELAMRLRGEGGRIAVMAITHIYYA